MGAAMILGENIGTTITANLAAPVSYTHLDVYKRQVLGSAICLGGALGFTKTNE